MGDLEPAVGLVIRHAYLWWNEARVGREEGVKDRPCVIVHKRQNEFNEIEVFICPITHTPPKSRERAMAIAEATKKRLRLDSRTSWIITTELNRFVWPGPDIRSVPGGDIAYGVLPAAMTHELVRQIKENARDRSLLVVRRDDPALKKMVRRQRRLGKPKGAR
jgi:hypothetical protein